MSKHESPILYAYWQTIGGTLIEEFPVLQRGDHHEQRRIDGLILPHGDFRQVDPHEVVISERDVVVVQVKARRLGMALMGQTLFSAMLMRRWTTGSIRAVALCTADDAELRPLMEQFPGLEVVVWTER